MISGKGGRLEDVCDGCGELTYPLWNHDDGYSISFICSICVQEIEKEEEKCRVCQ